jgi:hypothetical protein
MLSEKDMENAIAENPNRYLGEEGLELKKKEGSALDIGQ